MINDVVAGPVSRHERYLRPPENGGFFVRAPSMSTTRARNPWFEVSEGAASSTDTQLKRADAAQQLAVDYLDVWSAPNALALEAMPRFYAKQVEFHGRRMSAEALFAEKRRFVRRWPVRSYTARNERGDGGRFTTPPPSRLVVPLLSVLVRWVGRRVVRCSPSCLS
jgi:hypothetical protein